jgi:plastocyanin
MRLSAYVAVCLSLSLIVALAGCGGGIAPTAPPPSSPATPPTIVTNPASKTVAPGETATFSATATGSTPLTYQWQRDQAAISGATSASYTRLGTDDRQRRPVPVVVSNSAGNATSNPATLTVSSTPPTIVTNPASKTVAPGETATFSATATGSTPLTYQWQRDQADLGSHFGQLHHASGVPTDNGGCSVWS